MADTKNWTWVLERACPECGFDAAGLARGDIGERTRVVAATFAPLLTVGELVGQRPEREIWSALEYGCHVRDVFRIFDERLRRLLTEDDPEFADWDQDATALADRYGEQDPSRVRTELLAASDRLADAFDAVGDDQWDRRGRRSDGSVFTVESLGRYMVHDPVHHVWDVETGYDRLRTGPR